MFKCSNVKTKQRGFTIIELLVVISIITILSAVVFVSYQSGQQQLALQRSASKLAQDIRKVQEMAMSAQECQECGGGVPEGGYGIVFNLNWNVKKYRLYADTGGTSEFFQGDPPDTQVDSDIDLEKGVEISGLDVNGSRVKVSINFKPPDPKVTIKHTSGDAGEEGNMAEITLSLEADSSKTKTITVNSVGRINID